MKILVSEEISSVCPEFAGAAVEAWVTNTPYSDLLWQEINALAAQFKSLYTTITIKDIPSIDATRKVYKLCGLWNIYNGNFIATIKCIIINKCAIGFST